VEKRFLLWVVALGAACAQGVETSGGGDDDDDAGGGGHGAAHGGNAPMGGAGSSAHGGGPVGGGGAGVPDTCGDGIVQAGEGCDDANTIDTDDCPSTCVPASCGDGFVYQGVEACDDANDDDTDACVAGCVAASCGDGFTESGVEECDDANEIETDACVPGCLDAFCGDGFVQAGVEECDDGGAVSGDGCTSTCESEGNVFGPNHTFESLTSSFYITQFGCSNSGGDPGGDALYFCQHFYNAGCTAQAGWMAVSSSANPMMHSGTNCYNPDSAGVPVTGTSCVGGPCKIGNYVGPLGGLTNIVCDCP
jgi:cysteine-rich repeat protein